MADRKIISKETEVSEAVYGLNETLFHNANGYIGVRGCLEEGVPEGFDTMRGMYINGFYDIIPMKQAENLCNFVEEKQTMLNVADTQTIYLYIGDEKFTMTEGTVLKHQRTLDMDAGITIREVIWRSPKGKEVSICIKRMTSFEQLSLFTMEYQVTSLNFDGKITWESYHISDVTNYSNANDPRLAAESEKYLESQVLSAESGKSLSVSWTVKSGLTMCAAVSHRVRGEVLVENTVQQEGTTVVYQVSVNVQKDQAVTLGKYTVFTDSVHSDNPPEDAKAQMQAAWDQGLDYFYQKQRAYLKHFWHHSEMEIIGDAGMNQAVSFNMYQLLQSAARNSNCNIAAKGLSGEGYEGHYFWDTEMFMIPFFTLTNPELAKMLLTYRYDSLDAARKNARLLGHQKGALYPWRTITGEECSGYFPSGTAQYHIDGDIAYALVQYCLTTGDYEFIKEKGGEIIIETARLWLDVGNYSDGRFVINDVTGPDEYTCMVNNNYYTNCCAKYNLNWAVTAYELLKEKNEIAPLVQKIGITEEEILQMKQAAAAMYLPYDEKQKINPQDDSFLSKPVWNLKETPADKFPLLLHFHPLHLYRYQVCKQADTVLAYFLFEDEQSPEVMKRSYEYYEKITTHDSSLSTCVFSIVASRLGMEEKAYEYFGDSAKLDLENTHNNTKDGIHTANMGGCYMAIVNGFAGLRINQDGAALAPFLPQAWEGYRFKFRYRGNLIQVIVADRQVTVRLEEGGSLEIAVYGEKYLLQPGEAVTLDVKSSDI